MALPRGVSVSSLAEGGTETERAAREAEGDAARSGSPAGALAARCVGTAIHAALERLDLEAERAPQWASARGRIEAAVRAAAPAGVRERAQADALACWDALGEGPLAAALFALGKSVVARELPILLSPEGLGAAPVATGYVSGAIDLVYRDASGRLVVADYKTDRTLPAGDADARARYVRQGALYCRALAEALRPEVAPRFEIWWLRHGVVDRVDAPPASPSQLRLTF
jgi:ATP-dependent exoDNAse (exonuclease V) beta subunit